MLCGSNFLGFYLSLDANKCQSKFSEQKDMLKIQKVKIAKNQILTLLIIVGIWLSTIIGSTYFIFKLGSDAAMFYHYLMKSYIASYRDPRLKSKDLIYAEAHTIKFALGEYYRIGNRWYSPILETVVAKNIIPNDLPTQVMVKKLVLDQKKQFTDCNSLYYIDIIEDLAKSRNQSDEGKQWLSNMKKEGMKTCQNLRTDQELFTNQILSDPKITLIVENYVRRKKLENKDHNSIKMIADQTGLSEAEINEL